MIRFAPLCLSMLVILFSCSEDPVIVPPCTIIATIHKTDKCWGNSFYFELADGTVLQPIMPNYFMCITPGTAIERLKWDMEMRENALYNFTLVNGQKVKIGYRIRSEYPAQCLAIPVIMVTCIEVMDNGNGI